MELILDLAIQLLPAIVSVAAAVIAILNSRFTINWKSNSEKEIEKLRSELSQERMKAESLLAVQGNNCQAAQTRRIEAVEKIWEKWSKLKTALDQL